MRFSNTMLGAIFFLTGVALAGYSYSLPSLPGHNYGAATFPLFISAGLIGCSAKLIVMGIRQGREPLVYLYPELRNFRALAGVLTTILLILFYIYFARVLGFIPSAMLIAFLMFLFLKVHPVKAAIISFIAAFACDFIFRTMLLVPLPFGIVPHLPW